MIEFSYTISPQIKENLEEIKNLRVNILTTPLSQSDELKFRWKMMEEKIFYSLFLAESSLSKKEVNELISHTHSLGNGRQLTVPEEEVIDYRIALDYIKQYWYVSEKRIGTKTISLINSLCAGGRILPAHLNDVRVLLDYLQSQEEHPVIKAGIALIQMNTIRPFTLGNERTARLSMDLLLYKYGFDVKGAIAPEKFWSENQHTYNRLARVTTSSITPWLEFFTTSIRSTLEKSYTRMTTTQKEDSVHEPGFFDLNDRQRYILTLLDEPLTKITNKRVQKICKISQITASRDLTKLTTLGLLFAHGKGRSIYYTKV